MGARVASLCGAVLPGKVLQEERGWEREGCRVTSGASLA